MKINTAVLVLLATLTTTHAFAADYEIRINRTDLDAGTLRFKVDNELVIETPCWWNPKVKIPAKRYAGCSTTIMATKNYPAVYLPDDQTGKKGIFIHKGLSPRASDGCIVIAPEKIQKIYDTVPRDGQQLTVLVVD